MSKVFISFNTILQIKLMGRGPGGEQSHGPSGWTGVLLKTLLTHAQCVGYRLRLSVCIGVVGKVKPTPDLSTNQLQTTSALFL